MRTLTKTLKYDKVHAWDYQPGHCYKCKKGDKFFVDGPAELTIYGAVEVSGIAMEGFVALRGQYEVVCQANSYVHWHMVPQHLLFASGGTELEDPRDLHTDPDFEMFKAFARRLGIALPGEENIEPEEEYIDEEDFYFPLDTDSLEEEEPEFVQEEIELVPEQDEQLRDEEPEEQAEENGGEPVQGDQEPAAEPVEEASEAAEKT